MIDEVSENEHLQNVLQDDEWVQIVVRLRDRDGWDQSLHDIIMLAAATV